MTPITATSVSGLKGALRYVRAYRDSIFVVKLGGEVLADAEALDNIAAQVALLSSLGIRTVVVHGGGSQVDGLLLRLGEQPKKVEGRRITDDAALQAAIMVFAGQIRTSVLCALRRHGVGAVGLSGIDAELINATRRSTGAIDYGHVGDVQSVDPRVLEHLLAARFVPVVASLAADHDGQVYNINADTVAEVIAVALGAKKLVFITNAPGVLRDRHNPAALISFADADDLVPLLSDGTIEGGMKPKVEACLRAAAGGVERTHVIDGRASDALLLEVFTGSGVGTMIVTRKENREQDESPGDTSF